MEPPALRANYFEAADREEQHRGLNRRPIERRTCTCVLHVDRLGFSKHRDCAAIPFPGRRAIPVTSQWLVFSGSSQSVGLARVPDGA